MSTTTQAPSRNFVARNTAAAAAVNAAPAMSATAMSCQRGVRNRIARLARPTWLSVNPVNPDGEERHQSLGIPVDGDQQRGAEDAEQAHAVTEDGPLAAQAERVGEQVVAREQAEQDRQAAEGRIRGQRQHERRDDAEAK